MLYLLIGFAVTAVPSFVEEGLPVAPIDIRVGHQSVELRQALVARSAGARLVLFVREGGEGQGEISSIDEFRAALPAGSVSAVLSAGDGSERRFDHTGHTFYQGYHGLLLTAVRTGPRHGPERYSRLEFDSRVALSGVRVVWLDRDVINVRDVRPRL